MFEALFTWVEDEADFAEIPALAAGDDPVEALIEVCAAVVGFVRRTDPLFTNLRSLAVVDADLRSTVQRKDRARRRLLTRLVKRIPEDHLRVPRARARAVAVAVTSFESVKELLRDRRSITGAQDDVRWVVSELVRRPRTRRAQGPG